MTHETAGPLLIVDLDETLIFSTEHVLNRPHQFRVGPYYTYTRPGLETFLSGVLSDFRLAVWSSSSDEYAIEVAGAIFPSAADLEFVWGRSRCTARSDFYANTMVWAKNLKKVKKKGFALEQVLIVEDSPEKVADSYGNAIYVAPWTGDPGDRELIYLLAYLRSIRGSKNYRRIEKRNWKRSDFGNGA